MAMSGRRLDDYVIRQIRRLRRVLSIRQTAKELELARSTVEKYQKPLEPRDTQRQ